MNTNVLGYEVFIENGILSIQLADGTFRIIVLFNFWLMGTGITLQLP